MTNMPTVLSEAGQTIWWVSARFVGFEPAGLGCLDCDLMGFVGAVSHQGFCQNQTNAELEKIFRGLVRRFELLGVPLPAQVIADCCCYIARAILNAMPGVHVALDVWHFVMRYVILPRVQRVKDDEQGTATTTGTLTRLLGVPRTRTTSRSRMNSAMRSISSAERRRPTHATATTTTRRHVWTRSSRSLPRFRTFGAQELKRCVVPLSSIVL